MATFRVTFHPDVFTTGPFKDLLNDGEFAHARIRLTGNNFDPGDGVTIDTTDFFAGAEWQVGPTIAASAENLAGAINLSAVTFKATVRRRHPVGFLGSEAIDEPPATNDYEQVIEIKSTIPGLAVAAITMVEVDTNAIIELEGLNASDEFEGGGRIDHKSLLPGGFAGDQASARAIGKKQNVWLSQRPLGHKFVIASLNGQFIAGTTFAELGNVYLQPLSDLVDKQMAQVLRDGVAQTPTQVLAPTP